MKQHKINELHNFIKGFYIDKKICKNLIKYFEKNKNLHSQGRTKTGYNPKIKKSTDLAIFVGSEEKVIKDYLNSLSSCLIEYKKNYPHLDSHLPAWGIVESYNIQKYQPSEAFFEWHFERTHGLEGSEKRLLVFMTYLNTIKDAGETEFFYQKLKVKPEEGLTLIWPADWMFTHKGITSKTETKYIITGWYEFIK
jgi:hypothetical protein